MARVPYPDELERRQASLLQTMALTVLVAVLICLPIPFFAPLRLAGQLTIAALLGGVALAAVLSLWMVRRGQAQDAVLLLSGALAVLLCAMLYGNTLAGGAVTMFALALPIAISGLLGGRRGLLLIVAICVAGVAAAMALERAGAPGSGFAAPSGDITFGTISSFTVIAAVLALCIESLRALVVDALHARRSRERELEALSRRLEAAVRERTADLEMALADLERRAAEQQRLIGENARQQELIRDLSVPILPLGGRMAVLPLVGTLDAERIGLLQSQALGAIERLRARHLLLDITGVPIVDSFVAQGLVRTLDAARLLGAEVVLVGVRPEVAQSIVGLGLDLQALRSFADLQTAIAAIGRRGEARA